MTVFSPSMTQVGDEKLIMTVFRCLIKLDVVKPASFILIPHTVQVAVRLFAVCVNALKPNVTTYGTVADELDVAMITVVLISVATCTREAMLRSACHQPCHTSK